MRRLLVISIVLGLLLVGLAWVDVRVRMYVEDEARTRLAEAIPQAQRSEVEIVGFPFVGRILLDGSIERLVVTLHQLREGDVEVERVRLEVDRIVLDRDRLLADRVLAVTDVGRVRIEARITAEAASHAVAVPVELGDGKARVTVHGQTLDASIAIAARTVMLTVTGAPPLVIPLPPEKVLPCQPEVTIEGDRIAIACTASELPKAVMDVLGKGTG